VCEVSQARISVTGRPIAAVMSSVRMPCRGSGCAGGADLVVGDARGDAVVAVGDDGAAHFGEGGQVRVAAAGPWQAHLAA
jgi:hypothetical protein